MEKQNIRRILSFPDTELVNFLVKRANLSKHEWEVIKLREIDGETVESAAEILDVSPGTIKLRYRNAMKSYSMHRIRLHG